MGLIFKKRIKVGAFRVNLSRSGVSVAVKAGPVTENVTHRQTTVNLPGPFSWRGRRRR